MVAEASGVVEKWHLADVFMQYQMLPRHPSQLYEIALEGIALFFALFFFARKSRPMGAVSALFLIGYGLARFTVEFARGPTTSSACSRSACRWGSGCRCR